MYMDFFYKLVLIIALICLLIILTFMGIIMSSQTQTLIYPPTSYSCPDYWTSDGSGNCTMPTQKAFNDNSVFLNSGNKNTLGTNSTVAPFSSGPDYKSFSTENNLWSSTGKSKLCAQRDWALLSNISWDGVSNYNNC